MKKLFLAFVLLLSLILTACQSNDDDIEANENEEMTNEDIMEYLEQMTYRYVEALENEDGSFEQRSSLQAAIGRAESVYEEIEEQYEDSPILESFAEIRSNAVLGAEKGLEESFVYMEIHYETIEEIVQEISEEYLDGELPTAMQKIN